MKPSFDATYKAPQSNRHITFCEAYFTLANCSFHPYTLPAHLCPVRNGGKSTGAFLSTLFTRVAPDIISGPGPGRNPAKFSYPALAGYGRRIWGRIWGRIWPSFDASASLYNWAEIHCFTNSVICTFLFHHGHVDHTHILVSICISLLVT